MSLEIIQSCSSYSAYFNVIYCYLYSVHLWFGIIDIFICLATRFQNVAATTRLLTGMKPANTKRLYIGSICITGVSKLKINILKNAGRNPKQSRFWPIFGRPYLEHAFKTPRQPYIHSIARGMGFQMHIITASNSPRCSFYNASKSAKKRFSRKRS